MSFYNYIGKKIFLSNTNKFAGLIIRIATFSVAFSVIVMVLASALINGFQKEISEKIFGFWGHVHIVSYESNQSYESTPILHDTAMVRQLESIENVTFLHTPNILGNPLQLLQKEKNTHAGVLKVQPFATKAGILKTKNQFDGIVLKGVDQSYDWNRMMPYMIKGKGLSSNDSLSKKEIIISELTAKRLKLELGNKIRVHFMQGELQLVTQFVIKGIYSTGLQEYDKRFAIVDISNIQRLNGWDSTQIGGYEVIIEDIRDLSAFGEYINYNIVGYDQYAQTIDKIDENIFAWLQLQSTNKTVIMALMLLVALINVATALMILILERTQMIGVLKSLGSTNWQIQKIFLYYAGWIILVGMGIGNAVALGLATLQKYFKIIKLPDEAYYLKYAPIQLDWVEILSINGWLLFITLLVLILPTFIISSITPVKTLRFK